MAARLRLFENTSTFGAFWLTLVFLFLKTFDADGHELLAPRIVRLPGYLLAIPYSIERTHESAERIGDPT